jgi:hypothetical protein
LQALSTWVFIGSSCTTLPHEAQLHGVGHDERHDELLPVAAAQVEFESKV